MNETMSIYYLVENVNDLEKKLIYRIKKKNGVTFCYLVSNFLGKLKEEATVGLIIKNNNRGHTLSSSFFSKKLSIVFISNGDFDKLSEDEYLKLYK